MKTRPGPEDAFAFLAALPDRRRAEAAATVARIMERVTGAAPVLWGGVIIGFGEYAYRRREGSVHEWFLTGVAPRKAALSVHLMDGTDRHEAALARLGPHRRAVSCLYLPRLARVDFAVLETVIAASVEEMRRRVASSGA